MNKILLLVKDKSKKERYMKLLRSEYKVLHSDEVESALLTCAEMKVSLVVYEYSIEKTSDLSFLDLIRSVPQVPKIVAVASELSVEDKLEIMSKNIVEYYDDTDDDRLINARIGKIIKRNLRYLYGRVIESEKEDVVLECDVGTCYKSGEIVHLSSLEVAVLNAFLSAKNHTFTREYIYALVMGSVLYSSDLREIDEVIYKLRKKLSITSITSLQSIGYIWEE